VWRDTNDLRGDNPVKDFLAPNELGWLTVLISREGGEYGRAGGEMARLLRGEKGYSKLPAAN